MMVSYPAPGKTKISAKLRQPIEIADRIFPYASGRATCRASAISASDGTRQRRMISKTVGRRALRSEIHVSQSTNSRSGSAMSSNLEEPAG